MHLGPRRQTDAVGRPSASTHHLVNPAKALTNCVGRADQNRHPVLVAGFPSSNQESTDAEYGDPSQGDQNEIPRRWTCQMVLLSASIGAEPDLDAPGMTSGTAPLPTDPHGGEDARRQDHHSRHQPVDRNGEYENAENHARPQQRHPAAICQRSMIPTAPPVEDNRTAAKASSTFRADALRTMAGQRVPAGGTDFWMQHIVCGRTGWHEG